MNAKKVLLSMFFVFILAGTFAYSGSASNGSEKNYIKQKITAGNVEDVWVGDGGVFFNPSGYTGTLEIKRTQPETRTLRDVGRFKQRWLEYRFTDTEGNHLKFMRGFITVYYNLNRSLRQAWDADRLSIYFYNTKNHKWEECQTRLVAFRNEPYGRASCITNRPGLYGLVLTP